MIQNKMLHGEKFKSELRETSLGDFFFDFAEKNGNKICQVCINNKNI